MDGRSKLTYSTCTMCTLRCLVGSVFYSTLRNGDEEVTSPHLVSEVSRISGRMPPCHGHEQSLLFWLLLAGPSMAVEGCVAAFLVTGACPGCCPSSRAVCFHAPIQCHPHTGAAATRRCRKAAAWSPAQALSWQQPPLEASGRSGERLGPLIRSTWHAKSGTIAVEALALPAWGPGAWQTW